MRLDKYYLLEKRIRSNSKRINNKFYGKTVNYQNNDILFYIVFIP
jgi:hypothetical protein